MLKLWGMQCTPLLPLHPGPLWPGVVASDKALSKRFKQGTNKKLMLNLIIINRTVW